jgi:hypothetical protein
MTCTTTSATPASIATWHDHLFVVEQNLVHACRLAHGPNHTLNITVESDMDFPTCPLSLRIHSNWLMVATPSKSYKIILAHPHPLQPHPHNHQPCMRK